MDFAKFPFDSHRCKFLLGSTGYDKDFMKFNATYSYPAMEDIGIEQRPLQYWVKLWGNSLRELQIKLFEHKSIQLVQNCNKI